MKVDQCAQNVDDIGIAANSVTQLIRNISAVFDCISKTGFKLPIEKCRFGVTEFELLGRTITPEGVAPQDHKFQKFLASVRFPKSKNKFKDTLDLSTITATTFLAYLRTYSGFMSSKKQINKLE